MQQRGGANPTLESTNQQKYPLSKDSHGREGKYKRYATNASSHLFGLVAGAVLYYPVVERIS
jgi:hypothetical protein